MAKKAAPARRARRGRGAFYAVLALIAALALLACYMRLNAMMVHIRNTDVYLQDLPQEFDGTRILYLSDIDMHSEDCLEDTRRLMGRLQELRPDLLLLGGDYTDTSILQAINQGGNKSGAQDTAALRRRAELFAFLADFYAPMGKYAVLSRDEPSPEELGAYAAAGGVTLLQNEMVMLRRGGKTIYLAGLNTDEESMASLGALSGRVSRADCAIAFAHSVEALTGIQISEASDGGQWADLALFGKSHGGQIRLLGRTMIPLTAREQKNISGWYMENGTKLLVSQGLGCEGLRMRLGSQSEAHLLTLKSGDLPE